MAGFIEIMVASITPQIPITLSGAAASRNFIKHFLITSTISGCFA
jgi:hypothetical protein